MAHLVVNCSIYSIKSLSNC